MNIVTPKVAMMCERLVDLETHGNSLKIDGGRNTMEHGSLDAHLIHKVDCLKQGSTVDAPIVSLRGTEEEEFFFAQ